MQTKMNVMMMAIVVGIVLGIVGCRYDTGESQKAALEPAVRISPVKVGKIDWNDPLLALIYDESGDPHSPREILTLRFADRMLQCECFHDGNRYGVPYLYLHHQCSNDEWRYICSILNGCKMGQWSTNYEATDVCGGTSWSIEVLQEGTLRKRIHGYNAWPDNFEYFLKLKKFAMNHPAAIRAE